MGFTIVPPIGRLVMRPRLREMPDTRRKREKWLARVAEVEPELEAIVRELPDTRYAEEARVGLKYLRRSRSQGRR